MFSFRRSIPIIRMGVIANSAAILLGIHGRIDVAGLFAAGAIVITVITVVQDIAQHREYA
jgi:hypothetical protein